VIVARTNQFDPQHNMIAWNAHGRRQTKKYRPTVPVPSLILPHMEEWTCEADTFIHFDGQPVTDIRSPWARTEAICGVHLTPKSLRHFMATEMRKRDVPEEQRELWMGHRRQKTNDRYGVFHADYLKNARDCADSVFSELSELCKKPICRQVAAKSDTAAPRDKGGKFVRYHPKWVVGGTGIEPVTPTMSM